MNSIDIWRQAVLKYTPKAKDFPEALRLNRELLLRIWETYTQDRRNLGRLPATKPEFVAPYLLGFHLANVARIDGVLKRGFERGLTLPRPENGVRVVDLGCGTGAVTQAVLNSLRDKTDKISVELFDRSRHLLACAKDILGNLNPQAEIRGAAAALEESPLYKLSPKWAASPAGLTIFCFGFVWNEIGGNRKAAQQVQRTLDFWFKSKEPVWVLICEPAAEDGARATMGIRNFFVEDGWHVFYPCPKSLQCPMTRDNRDWCYSEFEFPKPKELIDVEKILKVSRRTLGGSAYLFLNPAARGAASHQSATTVVVGHPEDQSGKAQLLLCHGDKLSREAAKSRDLPLRCTVFKK
jgi:SAM-dependent methyltransferase